MLILFLIVLKTRPTTFQALLSLGNHVVCLWRAVYDQLEFSEEVWQLGQCLGVKLSVPTRKQGELAVRNGNETLSRSVVSRYCNSFATIPTRSTCKTQAGYTGTKLLWTPFQKRKLKEKHFFSFAHLLDKLGLGLIWSIHAECRVQSDCFCLLISSCFVAFSLQSNVLSVRAAKKIDCTKQLPEILLGSILSISWVQKFGTKFHSRRSKKYCWKSILE